MSRFWVIFPLALICASAGIAPAQEKPNEPDERKDESKKESSDERLPRGEHSDEEASRMVRTLATIDFPIRKADLFKSLGIDEKKLNKDGGGVSFSPDHGYYTDQYWVSANFKLITVSRWGKEKPDRDRITEARLVDHTSSFTFEPSPLVDKLKPVERETTKIEKEVMVTMYRLATAIGSFSYDYDGMAPTLVDELVTTSRLLELPLHPTQDPNAEDNEKDPFIYLGRGLQVTAVRQPSKYVIFYERKRYARHDEICIAFLDGHVSLVKIEIAEKIIRHQTNAGLKY